MSPIILFVPICTVIAYTSAVQCMKETGEEYITYIRLDATTRTALKFALSLSDHVCFMLEVTVNPPISPPPLALLLYRGPRDETSNRRGAYWRIYGIP